MSRPKRVFENQRLFTPNVVRRFTNSTGVVRKQTASSMSGSAPTSTTGSFRFDAPGTPLKSTQQLPIDFSAWENHTFFSSAESNVNIIFEKIINNFPFDGTREDYETWLDDLSGWEKYILDRYPSYTGYITLNQEGSATGPYVEVIDKAGVLFPSLSRVKTGKTILNPGRNSIFVEADIAIPNEATKRQFLFSHINTGSSKAEDVGYAVYVDSSTSSQNWAPLVFCVLSGSAAITSAYRLPKGKFERICFSYSREPSDRRAVILSGSTPVAASQRFNFTNINTAGAKLLIGSGSELAGAVAFNPEQTFSGSISKFRIFDNKRKKSQIDYFTKRTLFAEEDPLLNFRFNEATGSYTNNDIVLDHGGKSLHSRIKGYSTVVRSEKPFPSIMTFQSRVSHPTLFPSHPDVITMNEGLLMSASQYDANNPNLITKLIPEHYLEMASQSDFSVGGNADGDLLEGIKSVPEKYDAPGGARMGQPQIISALLFMWAREFDSVKMFIDHVSNLVFIDYEKDESIADQFIPFLAEYYGFELPNMFANADYRQLIDGENIAGDIVSMNLITIQNEMWRRILINLREVFNSKGTVHAIKTLFRSAGIDPDRMFRFMEYGGTTQFRLGKARKKITEISTMADFSGSLSAAGGTLSPQGYWSKNPVMTSTYLSSSRIEVGYPAIDGTFINKGEDYQYWQNDPGGLHPSGPLVFLPHGISNDKNDGLLTSGSWTVEGHFSFPITREFRAKQSLFRLHTTGTVAGRPAASQPAQALALNLVADPMNTSGSMTLYCRPGFQDDAPLLSLVLTGANVFDGDKWYVSVGRQRNDELGSHLSSSYFINAGRQDNGQIVEFYTTSSFFAETNDNNVYDNIFQRSRKSGSSDYDVNASGSFIAIGSQSLGNLNKANWGGYGFLNDTARSPDDARKLEFWGRAGHFRFWSKALDSDEVREHALNFSSLGVKDPLVNFSFANDVTGSFERLRLDLSTDQPVTASNAAGELVLVDFSQQLASGSSHYGGKLRGFETNKSIIRPERFVYSMISSYYDEPSQENKVRIAGFTEGENLFDLGGYPAPVYEIPRAAEPKDDSRFAIEFSMMQALNEDIMKIFATLDSLDNILGAPELMFAEDYPGLVDLRNVYFNRLTDRVNYRNFFDFFRWLDNSFDVMIEDLIPRKTNYLGFNFIIENHALERAKVAYGSGDVYLGESQRRNLKGMILLRQLIAQVRKI